MSLFFDSSYSINDMSACVRIELEDLFYKHRDIYRTTSFISDMLYRQLVTTVEQTTLYYENKKMHRMVDKDLFGDIVKVVKVNLDKQERRMSIGHGIHALNEQLEYFRKYGAIEISKGTYTKAQANRRFARLRHILALLKRLKDSGVTHI